MPDLKALLDRPVTRWSERDVEYAMNHPAFWQGGREATDAVRDAVRGWFDANHGDNAPENTPAGASPGDLDALEAALDALDASDPDEALDDAIRAHLTGLFRDPDTDDSPESAPEIEVLQEALNDAGGAILRLDGALGPKTRAAIRNAIAHGGAAPVVHKLRQLTEV